MATVFVTVAIFFILVVYEFWVVLVEEKWVFGVFCLVGFFILFLENAV
ncbi:hypothetical protein [Ornithinibacillus halophilus]|nr:hypothetical protein [Ornithinibacillus halophilus]